MKRTWKYAVLLALLGIAFVIVTQVTGRDVPTTPPRESRRVMHPLGFSIVSPTNWDSQIRVKPIGIVGPGIYMSPRTIGPPRRYSAALSVSVCDDRERLRDQHEMTADTVAGFPAFSRIVTADVGDGVPSFAYTAFLKSRDTWYVVRYNLSSDSAVLPGSVRDYIASFRVTPTDG
ncbi:hypothetical protein [Rubripirellula reticaptiva]|uniref:PsbP C-terminal domain-containing protein n=1 Tax=Rubripirellula reticaptiva TaxID=2528013 RepID=A0A5C6E9L4_9BACT|nr:hypothetical protein [Rubripirellula reticaptiva]TWU44431.1 hypothetical protein Poly59_61600 [Rubripirellula reticaptiva]TWU44492.1 hypothetical protein Poly59_61460 [Rubripirellula reticaptiva]